MIIETPQQLFDRAREVARLKHYSYQDRTSLLHWIRRFVAFHGRRNPLQMGEPEIEAFLTHLAVQGKVAASTQNQALNALVFLYRQVLRKELSESTAATRAMRPKRLPVVLTKEETRRILAAMSGTPKLVAYLLYGSGLRLLECLRLRVKDIDFAGNQIIVRDAKGSKDRVTVLPQATG